jgi:hypothetical protein
MQMTGTARKVLRVMEVPLIFLLNS